jgi:hypothetical protein
MADIFRLNNDDGSPGNWAYFSDVKGDIIDAGTDEQAARAMAAKEGPTTTIAQALAGDASTSPKPITETPNAPVSSGSGNDVSVPSVGDSSASSYSPFGPIISATEVIQPKPATPPTEKPAKAPLSPVFIKKLVEQLGRNTTNISIEFERFIFKLTGYTTEELAEDDADVEIIRMGWDAIWQSYLAGKDPPLWMILAFGYSCTTMRLISSAKRIEKKESKDDAKEAESTD